MKFDLRKIIVAVLIVILIVIAVIILIYNLGGKKYYLEADDMPVKAYYTKSGDGIKVVLNKPSDKKHSWDVSVSHEGFVKINNYSKSKKNVYEILPLEKEKMVTTEFLLRGNVDRRDVIYTVALSLYVDAKGVLSVEGTSLTKKEANKYGEVGGKKFGIETNDDGSVYLIIDGDDIWNYKCDAESVITAGPVTLDGKIEFIFTSAEKYYDITKGEKTNLSACVYSEILLKQIVLNLVQDENGKITVSDFKTEDYKIAVVVDEKAAEEFKKANGDIKLPKDATKIQYSDKTDYVLDKDNAGFTIHQAEFYVNGIKYEYSFSNAITDESAFTWRFENAEGIKKQNTDINGKSVNILSVPGKFALATWKDGDNVCSLFGYKFSETEFISVLKEII